MQLTQLSLALTNILSATSKIVPIPALNLDFTSGTLDPRINFTRTSNAAYFNNAGVLTTASTNVPRFDYDPVTLQPKGLLIEEGRTNLLTYSEQVDLWQFINVTATANAAIAPDGNTTADKIAVASGQALGNMYTYQTVSKAASSLTYTASIFAKKAEFNRISLFVNDNAVTTNRASVTISLVDGSTVTAASTTGTFTAATATVTPLLNDWYRITLTFTTSTETLLRFRVYSSDSIATVGNGTSGIYIWGAQLEIGLSSAAAPFPTSYIPTTTAQATRNPDIAVITGTNFSSWYNQSEGTVYSEMLTGTYAGGLDGGGSARGVAFISDGTNSNRYRLGALLNTYVVTSGGSVVTQLAVGIAAANTLYKQATCYKVNDFQFANNGTLSSGATSGNLPIAVNQIQLGTSTISNGFLNGHIRKLAYWNTRLPNQTLQYLSR